MKSRFFSGFSLATLWLALGVAVFISIDAYATRDVPLRVEQYRQEGMTDEEVLSVAIQEVFRVEPNHWWVHDKEPYLVFDSTRAYEIHPTFLNMFDLEIAFDDRGWLVGQLHIDLEPSSPGSVHAQTSTMR